MNYTIIKDKKPVLNTFIGSLICLSCYFTGKYFSHLCNNLLSGSVIGMILLFILLSLKIVKKEQVKVVCEFLLKNMILFFVPALAALTLIDFNTVKDSLLIIVLISIISTICVMGICSLFVEWRQNKEKK